MPIERILTEGSDDDFLPRDFPLKPGEIVTLQGKRWLVISHDWVYPSPAFPRHWQMTTTITDTFKFVQNPITQEVTPIPC